MKTTAAKAIPTVPGTPFAGGFYVRCFVVGTVDYALVVSPKAKGELAAQAWNKSLESVAGALSYNDGLANTTAMVKAGSALAKKTCALKIGGFTDWYLPSRLESLLLFGELRDGPGPFGENGAEAFSHEWYWTSQQSASYADYAWCQSFYYGLQYYHHKSDYSLRARAVRRVKL